jgi:hypothetical protein
MSTYAAGLKDREWDFLKAEYDTSIDLVKYYDDRHIDLLKFASTISAGVPTVVFGFYALSATVATYIWHFTVFIAGVSALAIASILASMLRNRVYFVFPARQANVIRRALLREQLGDGPGIFKNQMYTTARVPMIDWLSTQSLQLLFVALQSALFAAVCTYSWRRAGIKLTSVSDDLWVGVAWLLFLLLTGLIYLNRSSGLKADQILLGKKKRSAPTAAKDKQDPERSEETAQTRKSLGVKVQAGQNP